MNKIMKRVCVFVLLSGLGFTCNEVAANGKAKGLSSLGKRDPIWQIILATKKIATPYITQATKQVPQLKNRCLLGFVGLSALVGICACRKQIEQKAKLGWDYIKSGYNKLPLPFQVLVSAPIAITAGTLAAHYTSVVAPDKSTAEFLKKTAFTFTTGFVINKMTNIKKLFSEEQNPTDDLISKPVFEMLDSNENSDAISYEELSASCGEPQLQVFLNDLANRKCKNILLFGQSNTGKTTTAKDICAALHIDGMVVNASDLGAELYVGSAPKKINAVLEKMPSLSKGSVIVIDEADALLKESADFGQNNHQISVNKKIMDVLNLAHKNGLCIIMITNIRNPKEIPATIVNRFTRITGQSQGGYIIEKQLPTLLGRITICQRTVRETLKNTSDQTYLFPDLGAFCLHIAKFTDGCNNGEIASIVQKIIERHGRFAQNYQTAIVSIKTPYSLSIINRVINENNFEGLDQMIDFLGSLERATTDQKEKERIKKTKENYEERLEQSTKLRSNLMLNDYSIRMQDILALEKDPESIIEALETSMLTDLENALNPHKKRIEQLGKAQLKGYEQIVAAHKKLKECMPALLESLEAIKKAYPKESFKDLHENIEKFEKEIDEYIKDTTATKRAAIYRLDIFIKGKISKILEATFNASFSVFIVHGIAYETCVAEQGNGDTTRINLEKQQADLEATHKNPAAILDILKNTKMPAEDKVKALKKIIKEADMHGSNNSADAYKAVCRRYKHVKYYYETYRYHLPKMSRDDLLQVAQSVNHKLAFETITDSDIQQQNFENIILTELGIGPKATSLGGTLKSAAIKTIMTTWSCLKYPFTSPKQRLTFAGKISKKIARHGLDGDLDALELVKKVSTDPLKSKEIINREIVSAFLKKYDFTPSTDATALTNIFSAKPKDLYIRKGRDNILEVSADGKEFISLNTIRKEYEKHQIIEEDKKIETSTEV
ncbi:MAG: hypothetical protein UV38_C0003G0195 [candidate division TM6 bacterium GW2011_GWE2_42_60]|nr:MAG: hypothetical protein UV38_C0003G0195 [candidate division TM6 bacterium GW2011_GWE2_42_60]